MATSEEKAENGDATTTPVERTVVVVTSEIPVVMANTQSCEDAMDLSMKKPSLLTSAQDGKAVKVELIPSAFDVKINELIINADKKNNSSGQETGAGDRKPGHRSKRAKKRKQPPEKIVQGCKGSDYVIKPASQQQTTEIIIQSSDAAENSASEGSVQLESNVQTVIVESVLEGEKSAEKPVLPLKVPTVTVATSSPETIPVVTETSDVTQLPSSLLSTAFLSTNGKSMRPFKLYTQNRDLLAGIGLNQNNMNTLAAALSGRPLVSSTVVGSTASLPVTAFTPVSVTNPLIPASIPTGVPSTTISQVGSTAGRTGTLFSVPTSVITTTTPSAMRLMTLATEADKILKGKKQDVSSTTIKDETSDQSIADVPLVISTSTEGEQTMGHLNAGILKEDGTIELTLDATSQDRLALIQQRSTVSGHDSKHSNSKSKKKKREQLPDTMKTPSYWERRRKNNEAAKRSRDARRAKEDQIAIRAAILEQENMRLRIELQALKEETAQLRAKIYEQKKSDSS